MKAEILCAVGAVAIGAGFWLLHPSLALFWGGLVAIAVGVSTYRKESK